MTERPYVLSSCAMSVDGYIDDATEERLLLSNDADFDRVDEVRASCDAILVGANTIRRDNPRLLVRSSTRREERVAAGQAANPLKVTLTSKGDLDGSQHFFTAGEVEKIVYCGSSAAVATRRKLVGLATIVQLEEPLDLAALLADLYQRGVRRLLVEGGMATHTGLLTRGLVDELHLVVAPFFVGDVRAPRFVGEGSFPWNAEKPMDLAEVQRLGNVVLLRYLLKRSRSQRDA